MTDPAYVSIQSGRKSDHTANTSASGGIRTVLRCPEAGREIEDFKEFNFCPFCGDRV